MKQEDSKRIFIIGTGRNGSTLISDILATHPEIGFISNYQDKMPSQLSISKLNRLFSNNKRNLIGATNNTNNKVNYLLRLIPRHSEAYNFWNHFSGINFSRSFMADQVASKEAAQRLNIAIETIVHSTKKRVFLAKLTGPPRITYLESIFPNSTYIHIYRKPQDVLYSYLNAPYWKAGGGYEQVWWSNILSPEDNLLYMQNKRPEVLAALQIRNILLQTNKELRDIAPSKKTTIYYEDFLQSPHVITKKVLGFCGLDFPEYMKKKISLKNIYSNTPVNRYKSDALITKIFSINEDTPLY